MMTKIFTVGYEGGTAADLIATLKAANVDVLVDIREMPLSRKPGLSKTALSLSLPSFDIHYRHERWLGAPKPIRDALKSSGDYAAYFAGFDAYLETQRSALVDLAGEIDGAIALMCFERDPDQCHRKSVARVLSEIVGVKPKHLGVRSYGVSPRSSVYIGQGLSAA